MLAGIAVACLGHAHPVIREALATQASLLVHCSNKFIIEPQGHLIEKLGVGALAVGGVLLLAAKLVERIRERRTDRYRDVQK